MKVYVFFCLLIAFCALQNTSEASSRDELLQEIKKEQDKLEAVVNDLIQFKNNMSSDLENRLDKTKQWTTVDTASKRISSDIQSAVAKARKEGKNADACDKSTKPELFKIKQTASFKLDECVKITLRYTIPPRENITAHITACNQLKDYLGSMPKTCSSNKEACLAEKMPYVRSSVSSLENAAKDAKIAATNVVRNSLSSTAACNSNMQKAAAGALKKVAQDANNCIKNV